MEKVLFGAGCFWGVEESFRKLHGVNKTEVGYSGGITLNPTYQSVCEGNSNHVEVVLVEYDKDLISFNDLIDHFWKCHDPTTLNRQGPDIGTQYRSAIFYYDETQKKIAENSKDKYSKKNNIKIVTEISEVKNYYKAEEYHQRYILKTGLHCAI
ncbi:peptide-methionine (S)-S-oxide reductase MsrA [Pelagibacteraceae bacterium]|nr:peptide-methionine (S)-S-oxide reductase MsrA [Pelagibacteraceae bacterium]